MRGRRPHPMIRFLGAVQTASIASLVTQAAAQYGVPAQLALAVANQESGLNPNLVNARSGASGVMQLMPATAAQLGVTDIMDAQQNVNAGVRYLAMMISQFNGDTVAAVAAYDWGPGNVSNAIATYGAGNWLAYAPSETQNYIASVLGVTPTQYAATITGNTPQPITIDNETGQVVDVETSDGSEGDGITDVADLVPINNGAPSSNLLLLGGVAAAALYLLSDYL